MTGLDLAAHRVSVTVGERIGYDKLLLATGSAVRRLNVPGAEFDGVYYLRSLADCEAIKAAFATGERVANIGAGWIGLETAAAARAADCEVTIIERGELPLITVALGLSSANPGERRKRGVRLRKAEVLMAFILEFISCATFGGLVLSTGASHTHGTPGHRL